ncbi:MAG TPA: YceI family protein, partial [Acidimicrobiales bacterium]
FGGDTIKKTAVGRTPAISGSIIVQGTRVVKADIEADLSRLVSNEDRRDNRLRTSGLETDKFPTATFALSEPLDLGNPPRIGETMTVNASGNLTLHGVTKPVTVALQARWNGTSIDIAGNTPILMADFGITPPSVGGFVSVDDNGVLELQISFVPG